jgi:hypothetical protein
VPRRVEPTACHEAMKRYIQTLETTLRAQSDKRFAVEQQLEGAKRTLQAYEDALRYQRLTSTKKKKEEAA